MDADSLAVRVKEAIDASGLAIPVVARHARVSKSWIYDIINGDIESPGVDKLDRLAKALGVSRDFLLTGKDHEEPTVENLAQLVVWDNQQQQQRLRHLERVISAEVGRQLNERWESYLAQRLADLRQREPVLAEALDGQEAAAAQARQQQIVSDELDMRAARAVRQDQQGRKHREAAAGRAVGP